jgi:hypothetical protein
MDLGPAEQARTPENPEKDLEKRTAQAHLAIRKISPREDIEALHLVIPEGASGEQTMTFRRPPDPDRHILETFFQVNFNDKGEAVEANELEPKVQSFDDVLKRGRRGI